ncbi:hypothetical protein [Rhodanobacter sp. MP7CTX1]|uniref:hypothetical protein n=1 Tax=Rhodanobacter sp. MP7CTX1 TaxID=2723084 RepID=UPI00161266ED|nr:hypothetical protein [Rhodanobacter sp. MP7CTX1]MBB6189669.1 anti-sigma factor RsiW [Rhodanobacter sp. MP7CTX1]
MNHPIDDTIPPFDDEAREREWQAQERAMRRERLHLDSAGDDARVQRYRMLARALREAPQDSLPADFARRVAAKATSAPAGNVVTDRRFEFILIASIAIALVVAVVAVIALYGDAWLPPISAMLPVPGAMATRWLLAFAGCIGLSWLLAQWQPHGRERPLA